MGTTNSDEKVTWDDSLSWIDNVLQNIDDYLIKNRERGGDDSRFEAMQDLKKIARSAKLSRNYKSVKDKAAALKDKNITKYGFWGTWGKESFSYKILEIIIKQPLLEKEIRRQQTPGLTTEVREKGLSLKELQEKIQLARSDTEKIKALTALIQELENTNAALEGNIRKVSAENDTYRTAQARFDATKHRFDVELNDLRQAVQTERESAKRLQDHLIALRKEYDEYTLKMKAAVKLAADADDLKTQNAQLQVVIEEHKRAAGILQQRIIDLQKKLEEINTALKTSNAKVERLKTRDKLITAEVTALNAVQQSVKEKEHKVKRSELNLSDDLSSLKEQVRMLKEQLEAKFAEIKQLNERYEATCSLLANKIDELKKQKSNNEDMNQHYERVITQKGEENYKLQQFTNTLFSLLKEIVSLLSGEHKTKFDAKVNVLEEQKKQLLMPTPPPSPVSKAATPKTVRKNSRVVEIATLSSTKDAATTAQRSGSPVHAGKPAAASPSPSSSPKPSAANVTPP